MGLFPQFIRSLVQTIHSGTEMVSGVSQITLWKSMFWYSTSFPYWCFGNHSVKHLQFADYVTLGWKKLNLSHRRSRLDNRGGCKQPLQSCILEFNFLFHRSTDPVPDTVCTFHHQELRSTLLRDITVI